MTKKCKEQPLLLTNLTEGLLIPKFEKKITPSEIAQAPPIPPPPFVKTEDSAHHSFCSKEVKSIKSEIVETHKDLYIPAMVPSLQLHPLLHVIQCLL